MSLLSEQLALRGRVLLTERPVDLEALALGVFEGAAAYFNDKTGHLRLESLETRDGQPRLMPCIRDTKAAALLIDGEVLKGDAACFRCDNYLNCALGDKKGVFEFRLKPDNFGASFSKNLTVL